MKVRCPTCGAVMSLDVLIAHDDAREALIALTGISDDLFKAVLRYLTLFRPAEKDLSFNRVSKLVGEIAPMIRDGKIVRNRKTYPAPREAWIWAATRCLEARDAGKLTPLLTLPKVICWKTSRFGRLKRRRERRFCPLPRERG